MGNIRLTNFCQPTNLVITKEKFSYQFPNYTREILREGKASISSNVFDMINFIKNGTEQEAITLLTDVLDYENDANTAKLVRVIKQNSPNDLRPMVNKLRIENTQAFETAPQQEKPFDLMCGYASLTDFIQSFEKYFDLQSYINAENIYEYIADIAVKRVSEYNNINESELVGFQTNLEWLTTQYHPTFKNRVHSVFSAIYENQKSQVNVQEDYDIYAGQPNKGQFLRMMKELPFDLEMFEEMDDAMAFTAFKVLQHVAFHASKPSSQIMSPNDANVTAWFERVYDDALIIDLRSHYKNMAEKERASRNGENEFDVLCGTGSESKFVEYMQSLLNTFDYENFVRFNGGNVRDFVASEITKQVAEYNGMNVEVILDDNSNEDWAFNAYTLDVISTLVDWFKLTFSIGVGAIEISNNVNWNSGDIDLLAGENRLEDFIDIVVAKAQSLTNEAQKAYQNGTTTDFVAEIVADIVAEYNDKKTSEWYVEYGSTFEWFKSNYADNQILQIVEEVEKSLALNVTNNVDDDFDGLIDENDIDLSFI